MGRLCILGGMKAWPLLLVGISSRIGACAEPERRPPTTYVPLVRGPESASLPPGPLDPSPAPLGQDSPSTPVPVSSKAATNEKPSPASNPANDAKCFRTTPGDCCTEPGFKSKRQGNKTICPTGTILGKECKGFGKSCHP
ncbi:MAG: hypothetical protein JWO86_4024 [Myxococcaceae bacterium]|nr:hypothetical protein [Myxococcaceae bacterium]MEA2751452.1 hypothetical protein [Myxococcales bacterium]